jgi:glycosyltransferase involved in cell wall biosynthesis
MTNSNELSASGVLVVVPAFNEEKSIKKVVQELNTHGFDCVVIDDCSFDSTASLARDAGAFVLQHPFNLGVGGALRTGFKFAVRNGYQAVVQVDADGQHPAHQIHHLISATNETGADLVLGSRFITDDETMTIGRTRRLVMRILARVASNACNTKVTDSTSGFRLIRGQLLEEVSRKLPSNYLGDTFEALVAAGNAGYHIVEIPAQIVDRQHGFSSASRAEAMSFTLKGIAVALLKIHPQMTPKHDL